MPRSHEHKARFAVSLLKEGFAGASEILKPPYDSYEVKSGRTRLGTLHIRQASARPPSWLSLFRGVIDNMPSRVLSQHASAVLLMRASSRTFAISFGHGWQLIRPEAVQDKFGLRVALNSIDAERIKSIDRTRLDSLASKTRSQSTRSGTQDEFGIRQDQDLLRGITGMPRDDELGSPITGGDALHLHLPADLAQLRTYLARSLTAYASTAYRRDFGWIDHVSVVRDPTLETQLEKQLTERLRARNFTDMYLAIPDIIDWAETSGFHYTAGGELHDDVHFEMFIDGSRNADELETKSLRTRYVRQVGLAADTEIAKWSAYKCVNFETRLDGITYLLTDGNWYAVDHGFAAKTSRRVRAIPLCAMPLPSYNDDNEEAYNRRAARASAGNIVCLDRTSPGHGGGRSRIEFCDLYARTGELVYVKRYTGSPTLSHLFAQGVVPATTLRRDAEFLDKFNRSLPKAHRISTQARLDPQRHPVVFAIVSNSEGDIRDSLPFFSKVALVAAVDRLSEAGFPVQLVRIPNERPSVLRPARRRRRT